MTTRKPEGLYRTDAGTRDAEGFIAPEIGLVDHALYFTTAPDVLAKTQQVLRGERLDLPGAVIVWDETIGRRTGSKAVPGSWWAGRGSVTLCIAFTADLEDAEFVRDAAGRAVAAACTELGPDRVPTYADGLLSMDGKLLGMVQVHTLDVEVIVLVRVNAATDFSKAPAAVAAAHTTLAGVLDESRLPLGSFGTLPNTLSLKIMEQVPRALGLLA